MRSIPPISVVPLVWLALVAGCSGGGSTTTNSQTIAKLAGDGQSAAVGTAVATRPSVKITDQNNAAVSGVSVTFSVVSGGGSVTGASATTGSDGVATAGSWTLGATAGANTLYASASGVTGSPVTFTATGTAPTPATITKQAGDAQSASVSTAVTVAPAVKLVDASGNPVAGVAVTFAVASGGGSVAGGSATTNASGIATLGSWTLGATTGANTLTATATGNGITGNPATFTATATAAAFSPTANTTLSGTQTFGSVNIPTGVTVTFTSDLVLNVSGPVTIAGTLIGNCFNLTLTATGALTSSGNVNNGCSTTPTTPPALTIIAQGGYHVSGGTFTLGGSLNLTNDASLTDATFPVAPAPGIRTGGSGGAALHQAGICTVDAGATFIANPFSARDGVPGPVGGVAGGGSTWILQCTGELDLSSGILVHGQDGGAGGVGTDTRASATATGGNGGKGGIIKVRANYGDVVVPATSSGTNIQSGSGGAGGAATATATQVGSPGGGATATGGNGAAPGNIIVQANNGSIRIDGTVTLTSGYGGVGGAATAAAADGQTTAVCPAAQGGAAVATGGAGGATPDKQLIATGTVNGLSNVTLAGGNGGSGGAAKATGGRGGAGGVPGVACADGGNGGLMTAIGGQGGNTLLKDASGVLVGNGGNGGAIEFDGGNGGNGFSACTRPNIGVGGRGGSGTGTSGFEGAFGTGKVNGLAGGGRLNGTLNGGNSGSGLPPGHLGSVGFNGATSAAAFVVAAASLSPGQAGVACTYSFTATFVAVNDASNKRDTLWRLAGTRTVTITPGPVVTGQLGADGTYAQATGATPGVVLNGEFYISPVGQWDSRTLNQGVSGGTADVNFGGLFTFPNTPSGIHFVGTLILSGTSIGSPPIGAPITYNVIMDAIP